MWSIFYCESEVIFLLSIFFCFSFPLISFLSITFIFLHPQAFTKIQRSIHYNLTYSTIKLIQQTVKPKLGQRQVFFNKTLRWVSSLSLWLWRAMTVRFRRNAHKKSCSFKDDWNPLKLTLDVTMLQKAKLTLVTSLKQLNHDNYFTMLRSTQFGRINLNNSCNYLFHDRSSSSSSSSSKSSPRSKASSASASNSCFP